MTPRQLVAAKLTAALPPDFTVRAAPATLDGLTGPTVILWTEQVSPGALPGTWWDVALTALGAVPRTEAGPADDDLDAALADVLAALETDDTHGIRWTTADRGTLEGSWPAYTVHLVTTILKSEE